MTDKQRAKAIRHAEMKEARMTPISIGEASKLFNVEPVRDKESGEWVVKYGGREVRNRNRAAMWADLATINGYRVRYGKPEAKSN